MQQAPLFHNIYTITRTPDSSEDDEPPDPVDIQLENFTSRLSNAWNIDSSDEMQLIELHN